MAISPISTQDADPLSALSSYFGFEQFRPGQEEVIRRICDGGNVLAVMPTGSGKSLCYQLPALLSDGFTLVVSPLIALMKDQVDELDRLRIPATFINSSISPEEQRDRLEGARQGRYRLVYVAPERFRSPLFRQMLEQARVQAIAVDEAHCVSEWGHDFRPDYLRLRRFLEALQPRSIVALTATATPRVQKDIVEQLGLRDAQIIVTGFDRPTLSFSARRFSYERDKERALLRFVESREGTGIVYVGARKTAESLADMLFSYGIQARAYHAGLNDKARSEAQDGFMSGEARVLVATVAFGMGIDKSDVRFVFHYNMPGSPEAYYQEAGRAGRDGDPAECFLCSSPADYRLHEYFIQLAYPSAEQVEAVYEVLLSAKANSVMWQADKIAKAAAVKVPEGAVASCLRVLEQAGAVQRLDRPENPAAIRTGKAIADLRAEKIGPQQQRVIEALAGLYGADEPLWEDSVSLDHLARRAGTDPSLLDRHLREMDRAGLLSFHPPVRGRGVRILNGGARFDSIPVDWGLLARLRKWEYEKLDAMCAYVSTSGCRRAWIVRYFGEKHESNGPCSCDRCGGSTAIDAPSSMIRPASKATAYSDKETQTARAILGCVDQLPKALGIQKVVLVACGSKARWILESGFDTLPAFGAAQVRQEQANGVALRLVRDGCLKQSGGDYPTIALTEKGREVLRGAAELPVSSRTDLAPAPAPTEKRAKGESPAPAALPDRPMKDLELFATLKSWRAQEAKTKRVPVFKILPDVALAELARKRPRTQDELLEVKGIGPFKAKKYGAALLEWMQRAGAAQSPQDQPAQEYIPASDNAPAEYEAEDAPAGEEVSVVLTREDFEMDDAAFGGGEGVVAAGSATEPDEEASTAPAGQESPAAACAPAEPQRDSSPVVDAASPPRVQPLPDPLGALQVLAKVFLEADRELAREAFTRLRMYDAEILLERLTSGWDSAADERAQTRLIWAAGEIGLSEAEPWLARCAQAPNARIRLQAVDALRKIGGPRAGDLLAELAGDSDGKVQIAAIAALGQSGGPDAANVLERLAAGAPLSEAGKAAASALEKLRRASGDTNGCP